MSLLKRIERKGKSALATVLSVFAAVDRVTPDELSRIVVRRLLVIRQHNQMGDMLLAVPAFRAIRKRFNQARITLVAAPINAAVMVNNPCIDEVLVYAKQEHRRSPLRLLRFVRELRRRRFDAVIVLNTVSFSVTSMLLGFFSGARVRIGSTGRPFGYDLTSKFYHLELPLPDSDELEFMHESGHNVYPLTILGVNERDLSSLLIPTRDEEEACDRFIAAAAGACSGFVVVHPGAGKKQNVWPAENFAEVANWLQSFCSFSTVAVRGPADADAMDRFLSHCTSVPALLSSPGVGFLGALMKRAVLTFCNDTGVMHIAGAVGARCIAVFGPTSPSRWKPVGGHVVAVRASDGQLSSVTPDDVMTAVRRMPGVLQGNENNP